MATPAEYYAQVINDYRANYAFNHVENVNWDKVYGDNVGKFTPDMNQEAFARTLVDSLKFLHNEHWQVRLPNGQQFGGWPYDNEMNFIRNPQTGKLDTDFIGQKYASYMSAEQYGVSWGITKENLGYICLKTQSGNTDTLTQDIIDGIFSNLQNTAGLIFDIRSNGGGDSHVGDRFGYHFTDKNVLYGYWEDKITGNDLPLTLRDDGQRFYDKPVVTLTGNYVASSAEMLGYGLEKIPGVTIIGDHSFGPDALAAGSPWNEQYTSFKSLDNGIQYQIPSRYAELTTEKLYKKYNPITPDLSISPEASISNNSDFVLEKAIGNLIEQTDGNIYYKYHDALTNTDLITRSAVEMVSANYNMGNYTLTGTSTAFELTGNMGIWDAGFMKSVYFDENYYLQQKTDALNIDNYDNHAWDTQATFTAINDAGMSVWEHFMRFGAFEKAADGTYGIDPSSFFDMSSYYADKIEQCKSIEQIYTQESIVQAFEDAGLDPINHYSLYGYLENVTPVW